METNRCLSRITQYPTAQYFGDNKHRFYLEYRCGRPCIAANASICMGCISKTEKTKAQHSRTFPHGKVNEWIPSSSHIYGGSWYMDGVRKWGAPHQEAIDLALQFQSEARGNFVVPPQGPQLEKPVKATALSQVEMPPRKISTESGEAVKKIRRPKVGQEIPTEEPVKPKRLKKKPTVGDAPHNAPHDAIAMLTTVPAVPAPPVEQKAPRKLKKKPQVGQEALPVHKEVVLPTHMEVSIDEVDLRDYSKEYVHVSLFECNHTMYFRESAKNKLYKRIKDTIMGAYVGRYDPDTESLVTDVPDSDDETD
jgi:hypothetical protein